MLLESFSQMIMRFLRIPPGTSLRKQYGDDYKSTSTQTASNEILQALETVNAMVDITVDDICIGNSPYYMSYKTDTPNEVKEVLDGICAELNSIAKDTAKALCKNGFFICKAYVKDNKLILMPYIKPVDFYLTDKKTVVVFTDDEEEDLSDVLVYINYEAVDLVELPENNEIEKLPKGVVYRIIPRPMQVRNVEQTAYNLAYTEKCILRYRKQVSRLVRWVNVDVGVSQGNKEKEVVDGISSALNADSLSLTPTDENNDFDDNIPVLPNRRGVGKPEITEGNPNPNFKEMADMDYLLSKLHLGMRFPATYSDFSKALDQTAVSLIRGDVRYSRMIKSIQSKMCDTSNAFLGASSKYSKYNPVVSLTVLPTPEDEDVVASLDNFTDFLQKVNDFIEGSETAKGKIDKLILLEDLFGNSAKLPMLSKWFSDYRNIIMSAEQGEEEVTSDEGGEGISEPLMLENIPTEETSSETDQINSEGIE